jgi:hypothetical protein
VDEERIIRGLAAALPETFAGRDLVEAYYVDWEPNPARRWLAYIAVPDARTWIERNALDIDHVACVARVRPGGEDALRRYFDYFESLAPDPDRDVQNLLMIELFESVVWVQDVIEYVGPHTRAVMRRAQEQLAWCSSAIGRWPEPPAPKRKGARHPKL